MTGGTKPRLRPGEVVGRYRIDGIVGKGGFGAVYRATQLDTGTPVALKILLKNFSSSKTDSKRFKREAALVQKLRHPNVVELLDFGYTDRQQPFIAFELLEGQALSAVLKEGGAIPVWRAAAIARDVLEALEAAHAFGVIHRDIKPANVFLLNGAAGAKVLDFGIAKAVSGEEAGGTQLTEAGQMIGTPHYMAPEQVRGTGVVPATDLYALGLVMAEMITGARVVTGDALIDVYMEHIQDGQLDFSEAVRVSPLWPVIERATHKALDGRYASASDMLRDLKPILASLSSVASASVTTPALAPLDELNETFRMNRAQPTSAGLSELTADEPLGSGTVLMNHGQARQAADRIAQALAHRPSMPITTTPMPASVEPSSSYPVPGSSPPSGVSSSPPGSFPPLSSAPPREGSARAVQRATTPLTGLTAPDDPLAATVDMSDAELRSFLSKRLASAAHAATTPSPGVHPPPEEPARLSAVGPAPPPARAPRPRSGGIYLLLGLIMVALVVAVLLLARPF